MSLSCTNDNCFPDTTCALGHLNRKDCKHWTEHDGKTSENSDQSEVATSDIPWNGYALGTSDLSILGGRGQPIVIGLIGPPDSGKTSLLAFIYMTLLRYGRIGEWDFAGSWTLGGWESIIHHCRWTGEPPPTFPPHTSSSGRHPGILHTTLRKRDSGLLRDVLFTDAPGEWFTQWARAPLESTATGARWVIDHANILLTLIDCEALSDARKLPQARHATRDLLERIGAENRNCPVMVLWTKDDVDVPDKVRESILLSCEQFLPRTVHMRTTVEKPESIEKCFTEAISTGSNYNLPLEILEPRNSKDPFLSFRGTHARD